jgi:hypothetical protein
MSRSVVSRLTYLAHDDFELMTVNRCLESLKADVTVGLPIVFSGYAGEHRAVRFGRFVFVYQYSSVEIRIKDVELMQEA